MAITVGDAEDDFRPTDSNPELSRKEHNTNLPDMPTCYADKAGAPLSAAHAHVAQNPFAKMLSAASTLCERKRIIQAELRALGMDWFSYGTAIHDNGLWAPKTFMNSYSCPEAWISKYFSAGYGEVDPRLQHGITSVLPYIWDIPMLERILSKQSSAKAQAFLQDLQLSGLQSGIVFGFPTDLPNERSFFSFCSQQRLTEHLSQDQIGRMMIFGFVFHHGHEPQNRSHRLAVNSRPSQREDGGDICKIIFDQLSDAERRILDLLSQGLRDKQIAYQLGISMSGVDYYLRRLRKQFDVRSRTGLAALWVEAQRRKRSRHV